MYSLSSTGLIISLNNAPMEERDDLSNWNNVEKKKRKPKTAMSEIKSPTTTNLKFEVVLNILENSPTEILYHLLKFVDQPYTIAAVSMVFELCILTL